MIAHVGCDSRGWPERSTPAPVGGRLDFGTTRFSGDPILSAPLTPALSPAGRGGQARMWTPLSPAGRGAGGEDRRYTCIRSAFGRGRDDTESTGGRRYGRGVRHRAGHRPDDRRARRRGRGD